MGASSRDLNDWADALDASNDDDARTAVVALMKNAQFAGDVARLLTRDLSDLPVAGAAKAASRSVDEVLSSLTYVAAGFERHERGTH